MPLTSQQRIAVTQFIAFTNADKKLAERTLKSNLWNVENAVNAYFNTSPTSSNPHAAALNTLFDGFRDDAASYPDTIRIDGTMSYLNALGIDVEDIGMLVVSELVGSPTMGEIEREGFVSGWSRRGEGASTPEAQRKVLESIKSQLHLKESRSNADAPFTRVYRAAFPLGLQGGSRVMPLEMAAEYWKVLLGEHGVQWVGKDGTPWLDWWVECLERKNKPINKDLWNQTLRVADKVLEDETLSWWNEEESWPSAVDEFVEWVRKEKGAGKVDGMDVDA